MEMKVLKKEQIGKSTFIQIEEWHNDYDFIPYGSTIAIYKQSTKTAGGAFGPRAGENYRFQFDFKSNEEAEAAWVDILNGKKRPSDYANCVQKYADCL